jgi:hypothetical protein
MDAIHSEVKHCHGNWEGDFRGEINATETPLHLIGEGGIVHTLVKKTNVGGGLMKWSWTNQFAFLNSMT